MQLKRRVVVWTAAAILGATQAAGCAPLVTVPDDDVITARVKSALGRATPASATDIVVTTQDGIVQLSGYVPSQDAVRRATEAARRIDGVKLVQNELQVAPVK